jgi:hypothetical protein
MGRRIRGGTIERDTMTAQLRALKVEDGDLVLMRLTGANKQMLLRGQQVLSGALATLGRKAVGLVSNEEMMLDILPDRLPAEFLEQQAAQEIDVLRAERNDMKRRHAEELGTLNQKVARLNETITTLRRQIADNRRHELDETAPAPETVSFGRVYTDTMVRKLSEPELRAAFERACEFPSCRARSQRLNANYCRGHKTILTELEMRGSDPLNLKDNREVDHKGRQ